MSTSTIAAKAQEYEVVIGLEIHSQMLTASKMFCGCSTTFGAPPNAQTCPVCIGMPGVLPVLNKKAVEFTIKAGLALKCSISAYSRFARKNYFYPDLPKGYQISQYELPICEGGYLMIQSGEGERRIGLTRIHMEEDAGKNIHEGATAHSFVDLNRAGVPLMEIVSEPDLRSPAEAAEFMRKLRSILRYLEVCDGNMEQGSLRCDANVSLRPRGADYLGVKTEIKNINSFRFVEKALEYEIKRQERILKEGGTIIQETRLWDTTSNVTLSMRSKEEAHDYRYFPEPDLVPLAVPQEWIDETGKSLPELPDDKIRRYREDYGLPAYDAGQLAAERRTALWFEDVIALGASPKGASNWIMGELSRLLNEKGVTLEQSPLTPAHLHEMLQLIDNKTISGTIAKTVFEEMFTTGKGAAEVIKDRGLVQISDEGAIYAVVDEVLARNTKEVERYRSGETKLLGFFVGQVMKAMKGKGNPQMVNEVVQKKLN